jgi:hypothetical protein
MEESMCTGLVESTVTYPTLMWDFYRVFELEFKLGPPSHLPFASLY